MNNNKTNTPTIKFVSAVLEKDFVSAKSLFKQMIHQRSLNLIQDKRIAVAKQMMSNLPG